MENDIKNELECDISDWQLRWLEAHGDRNKTHVMCENGRSYVEMGLAGGGTEIVFLPDDENCKAYFND